MSQQFVNAVPLDVVKSPALAVLVNFGLVAGRKPTRAELEELAHAVREVVPILTVVDEQRFEVGEEIEVLLEEVRIEVPESAVAMTGSDPLSLRTRIVEIADRWVSRCATDAGEPATLAERIAREAVVGDDGAPINGTVAEAPPTS